MDKFHSLKGIAAPLPIVNIDTDMIIPKQFLKTIKRTGLGVSLFYEMRYDNDGNLIKDFVLNTSPFDQSKILVAGDNFGCGSSSCLLYTSPSPRDKRQSRMPSSA